jgi:iron complex outermembrane recepter protein
MMKRAVQGLFAVAAVSVGISADAARAQNSEADVASGPVVDDGQGIDSIIVTARRRSEDLQSTPVSVTVLDSEALTSFQVTRVDDLMRIAPSLTVAPSLGRGSTPQFMIRSQRESTSYLTSDPAVGTYFSEAAQARPVGLGRALFDLESVQVLKGAQGTLFGRNTTGGAILITPRKPSDRLEGYASVGYGSYEAFTGEAVLNLPVSDKFALRAAVSVADRTGYTPNITTNTRDDAESTQSYRVSAQLKPNDDISLLLIADHFRAKSRTIAYVIGAIKPVGELCNGDECFINFFPGSRDVLAERLRPGNNRTTASGNSGDTYARNTGLTSIATVQLDDNLSVKNIFSFRKVRSEDDVDFDGLPLDVLSNSEQAESTQYSEELQFQGKAFSDKINYTAGFFYFQESGFRAETLYFGGYPILFRTDARNISTALYAQADFNLSDSVRVTAGLRKTWDNRRAEQDYDDGFAPFNDTGNIDYSALTYTLGADWKASDEVFFYAAHRKGYRSGGFASSADSALQFVPFRPENVKDYELGMKTQWRVGDLRGRLNVALFYSDYKDVQRTIPVDSPSGIGFATRNAASATIRGAEIEYVIQPTDSLEISGFYALSRARYTSFKTLIGNTVIDLSNNRFGLSPDHMFRIAGQWQTPLHPFGGNVIINADYSWRSDIFFTDRNEIGSEQKAYGIANLNVVLEGGESNPVSFSIFARNLLDKSYNITSTSIYQSFGFRTFIFGEPRTWGVQLKVPFGK